MENLRTFSCTIEWREIDLHPWTFFDYASLGLSCFAIVFGTVFIWRNFARRLGQSFHFFEVNGVVGESKIWSTTKISTSTTTSGGGGGGYISPEYGGHVSVAPTKTTSSTESRSFEHQRYFFSLTGDAQAKLAKAEVVETLTDSSFSASAGSPVALRVAERRGAQSIIGLQNKKNKSKHVFEGRIESYFVFTKFMLIAFVPLELIAVKLLLAWRLNDYQAPLAGVIFDGDFSVYEHIFFPPFLVLSLLVGVIAGLVARRSLLRWWMHGLAWTYVGRD